MIIIPESMKMALRRTAEGHDDGMPWEVFADWLEEQGEDAEWCAAIRERGGFIIKIGMFGFPKNRGPANINLFAGGKLIALWMAGKSVGRRSFPSVTEPLPAELSLEEIEAALTESPEEPAGEDQEPPSSPPLPP